jgi:hypothetical protein
MRGWQMIDRSTDRLRLSEIDVIDVWAYTHRETVIRYAITQ